MEYLHVLSEDAHDDIFYQGCAEKIRGCAFEKMALRLRPGGGIRRVRRYFPILLKQIKFTGAMEDTFFIVSLDNDRSLLHPNHQNPLDPGKMSKLPKREQAKPCRFCELEGIVKEHFGSEPWPIGGAIAVPVQMLESWLLLICNQERYKTEASLPLFSTKQALLARHYFAPHPPPNQLKDLKEIEKERLGIASNQDFCTYCIDHLEPNGLAKVSPSFALFKEQVEGWR